MNLTAQIAKHFRDVHFGGNWTTTNLRDTLADITWEQATTQVDSFNTIAVLVYHINYFVDALLMVLRGQPLTAHDRYSFDCPPIGSQEEWEALQEKLWQDARNAAELIKQLPESIMSEDFADPKYGTWFRNLHGTIEHTHYHLGQIVILKKLLQSGG